MENDIEFSGRAGKDVASRQVRKPARVDLSIGGMACSHCPPMVEKALKGIDGVQAAQVNLSTGTASVDYAFERTSVLHLVQAIRSAGYSPDTAKTARLMSNTRTPGALRHELRRAR
jgi:copper chaperone CopZ